jgi:quaternary ammonium compound-resistance protein SugE
MSQPWLVLLLAGAFEIGMTTCLLLSKGFTRPPWGFFFFVCAMISFLLLSRATSAGIPMGTAYAVWTGIGAAGTAAIGMFFFGESMSLPRVLLIAALVSCIVGLKYLSGDKPDAAAGPSISTHRTADGD